MVFAPDEQVVLPIGLDWEGQRFRTFGIDEMTGYDEEALANKAHRNNGAKAMSALLQRCIQSIEGLVEPKKKRFAKIQREYVTALYTPDRDYLFFAIRSLGMEPTFSVAIQCPRCGDDYDYEVDIRELDVLEWEAGEDPILDIKLPKGFEKEGKLYQNVRWRFATGKQQEQLSAMPRSKITTAMLAACIIGVDGLDVRPDSEMVRRLRTRDRLFLTTYVQEHTPGVDLRVDCWCDNCENEWVGEVDPSHFFNVGGQAPSKTTKGGKRTQRKLKRRSRKR